MSNVKLSGKPAGATHYGIHNGCVNWYKFDGQSWDLWFSRSWASLDSRKPRIEVIEIVEDPQAAADERLHLIKNACTDINKTIEHYNCSLDCSVAIRATVEAMIDAGYRKT